MGRAHADMLVEVLRSHPEWHKNLIDIFLSNEEPFSRKIAWAIDLYSEENPKLIIPHLQSMIELLPHFTHDALRRHSLHILSRLALPASGTGQLLSFCFDQLLSPGVPAAVKVYSMEILYSISVMEPGIRQELADSIEIRLNEETPGFKNRGLKILKRLSRNN